MVEIGNFTGSTYTAIDNLAVQDATGERVVIRAGESFQVEDLMPLRYWHDSKTNYYWITGGRCIADDSIIAFLSGHHIFIGGVIPETEFEGSVSRLSLVE